MTKIYVGSFTTCNDFDAQMTDDGGYDTVADMAMGCTAAAGTDRNRVMEKVKDMMRAEAREVEELTEDDDLTFEFPIGYGGGFPGVDNSWLSIDVSLGADPYGVIIIREFDEA